MAKLTKKTIKIIKTFNLYCCFFGLGLCVAIPGPTLIDLTYLVNTSIKTIALIYTARSLGYLFGSLAGGVLFDMIERKQFVLTIFNFTASFTMFGLPWSRTIQTLTVWMVGNGVSLGVLDTGGNVCCLNLWGQESGPFYQALHFTFGIGGLVAPLIAAPFLGNYSSLIKSDNSSLNFINQTYNSSSLIRNEFQNETFGTSTYIPPVTYAYTAIGAYSFIVAMMFLLMCFLAPSDETGKKEETADINRKRLCLTAVLVILCAILILTSMGTEVGYAQMLTTYATKGPLHLSTVTGSYMTSTYWAAFTISRLSAIFLAIKFSNMLMVVLDVLLTTIGSIGLLFLAPHFEWALWLSSIILGVGIASFFPSSVGWLDQYIPVTNKIASMFAVGAAFGEMLIPFTISYFIDEFPDVFLYVNLASCIVAIFVTLTMYLIVKKLPNRFFVQKGVTNAAYVADNNEIKM